MTIANTTALALLAMLRTAVLRRVRTAAVAVVRERSGAVQY